MPYTRSRTGCLTCRDEGYKCDEGKPQCGRCIRLGKACKGYGLRVRWKTADSMADGGRIMKKKTSRSRKEPGSRTKTTTAAAAAFDLGQGNLLRNPSYLPSDVSSMNRFLLHHWNSSLASVISMASGTQNPFLMHLTPMMLRSDALLFSITSMAAGHLADLRDDESLRILSSRHMLTAVSSLRESIETENPELSLATILMLQISDRLFSTHSQIDHLAGAKAVIMHSGGLEGWTGSSARFLLSICFYHDVMSSISRASRPLLSMTNVAPLEGLQSLATLTSLVSIVSTISKMQGQSGEAHQRRGLAIRETLEGFPIAVDGDPAIENTIQAYRHAALVYLCRVWSNGESPPKPFYAARCLHYLLQVPVTSSFVSAHAWPLWTAGCESVDPGQRQIVLERLRAMYQNRHLPSLKRAQEDMEEVWRAKDSQRLQFGTENVDCCKVILYKRHREADLV
ncbi:hypothetical protein LY76DRAFT_524866 [Colletotrichum caudatum]|nr:hypothetical protein LY76DRAFT_524866 [Colletotrichum caudatum]